MAAPAFLFSNHYRVFTLFVFFLKAALADSNFSSSFSGFGKDSKFESKFALYGDARLVNGGNAVQLADSVGSGVGRVMYKKPIKLVEGKPKKLVYFSTNFSFSSFPGNGDGLAFNIVPTALNLSGFGNRSEKHKFNVTVVHFKTFRDSNHENLLENRVGIYVGSSSSDGLSDSTNASSSSRHLVLSSVEKLQAWIDYEVGSRRLEVRLGKNGDLRPSRPLLSHPIDFTQLWGAEEQVFIGLSSSHKCSVYSWSFKLKTVPKWMHSQPLDPEGFDKNSKSAPVKEKKDCLIRVLAAMIFGTGTGALTALVVLYLWTLFGSRRPVMPEEFPVRPVDSEYKMVEVVVFDKSIEDGKKVDV